MQNFGFIFPGQGSQKLGMLSNLASKSSVIESTFAEASDILGLDLWEVTQSDEKNILGQTEITQPVLLTASIAIWRVWQDMTDLKPSVVAGHSLGEYSALVCAQSINFRDAVRIVHKRGQIMQAAVKKGDGKMASIIGLGDAEVTRLCNEASSGTGIVSAANFNSPGQTVIAGDTESVNRAIEFCKKAGAKRVLLLNVSVPSHCDLMKPAAELLERELASVEIKAPNVAVIQNADGKLGGEPERIKQNLIKQLYSPVLWVDCVKEIHKAGFYVLIECGPGKVLSGLVKRIESDIRCSGSDSEEAIETALADLTTKSL